MKSEENIVKLSKEEVNELLYYIYQDNERNGLIFKLMYIYAQSISNILRLKRVNVDLKHNTLDFIFDNCSYSFMLHKDIRDDLIRYLDDADGLYLFIDEDMDTVTNDDLNIYRVRLNQYLSNFIKKLNQEQALKWKCPNLYCTDFKILRGQHLFLDGVDVHVIHDLYGYKNIINTKNAIKYKDLLGVRFPCDSLDCVFNEFTDLNLYRDHDFDGVGVFSVCDGGGCVVVEYDYRLHELTIIGGSNDGLVDVLLGYDSGVLCDLFDSICVGDYKFLDGLKVIRN